MLLKLIEELKDGNNVYAEFMAIDMEDDGYSPFLLEFIFDKYQSL